jgi:uncharacterized protein YbjT (DUF2867 family)
MKQAFVVGSTGLVGNILLEKLLSNRNFSSVSVLVRKNSGRIHDKLTEHVIDFGKIETLGNLMKTDVLFCCLGSTIKKAGSKEAFKKVDLEYVAELARIAERNRIRKFIVISSVGAHPFSRNFYLRTKGEMELMVMACEIEQKHFIRPGLILGHRKEFRFGEWLAALLSPLFMPLLSGSWKKYRPVSADAIASCMLHLALVDESTEIIENELIEKFSEMQLKDYL